jgi:signal transduction histidine kinase
MWRATPAVALSVAIVLLLAGLATGLIAQRNYALQKTREVNVEARILASTVTAALSFDDRKAAQEYVSALQVNPEILQEAGALYASFSRDPDGVVPRLPARRDYWQEANRLHVVAPVMEGAHRLGTVYLQAITEPRTRRYARFGIIALLATMVALVVAVLGIAHATLTRANDELQQQSAALAAANARLLQQIGEREKAEDALRQAQKMEAIGHLTGGVAHDFNNLLQIILSSLSVVRRRAEKWGLPPDAERDFRRYMEAAATGGERAAALTRQLLAFARRQPLEPSRVDVNKLVAGMSELLRRTLGETIAIETVLAGGLWPVFADPNQLASAVLNLAVNARDAMPGGGKLTIETGNAALDETYVRAHDDLEAGQYVMVAVTDTGAGMSREVLDKVFEPFFTTKDVGHGTGLGLSQVYGFVKQSGGHVKIYSELGSGTAVKLYLPRLLAGVGGDEALPEQAIAKSSDAELILVVEDEASVRQLSVEMLQELGYGVLEAGDGEAALLVLEAHPEVRLLFTDVGLPGGLNGRQLADAARRRRPELKVLFTSGYTRNAIVHGGRLDAGVALIGKPFSFAGLAEKVREVLRG